MSKIRISSYYPVRYIEHFVDNPFREYGIIKPLYDSLERKLCSNINFIIIDSWSL